MWKYEVTGFKQCHWEKDGDDAHIGRKEGTRMLERPSWEAVERSAGLEKRGWKEIARKRSGNERERG